MRWHRFIGRFNLADNKLRVNDKIILNQIKKVLRMKVGDQLILADGQNNEAIVKITGFDKDFFEAQVLSRQVNNKEPEVEAILYCALLKKENFEWVVQKATEVGVAAIFPIITERTVKLNLNQERLRKIAQEAAEQSGRGKVPEICSVVSFIEAVNFAKQNKHNLFFDPVASLKIESVLNKIKEGERVGIFIGPEGGWSDFELDLAEQRNFLIVNLSQLILRAETAAVTAVYLVCNS